MSQYEFDAERFCLVRARAARAQRNFSDEQNFLRVAEEVKRLRRDVAALKEAVCKVVEMHRKGEGHVCTHYPSGRRAIDKLAALVGEEGK